MNELILSHDACVVVEFHVPTFKSEGCIGRSAGWEEGTQVWLCPSFPMSFRILGFFPNNVGPITHLKVFRYLASDQVILCMASVIMYSSLVAVYEGSSKEVGSFLKSSVSSFMSGLGCQGYLCYVSTACRSLCSPKISLSPSGNLTTSTFCPPYMPSVLISKPFPTGSELSP